MYRYGMIEMIGCVICGEMANLVQRERKLDFVFQGPTCDSCYENYKESTVEEILNK